MIQIGIENIYPLDLLNINIPKSIKLAKKLEYFKDELGVLYIGKTIKDKLGSLHIGKAAGAVASKIIRVRKSIARFYSELHQKQKEDLKILYRGRGRMAPPQDWRPRSHREGRKGLRGHEMRLRAARKPRKMRSVPIRKIVFNP